MWHRKYVEQAIKQPFNDAELDYNVYVERNFNLRGQPYFRASVHHLTPEENKGGHYLFIEVIDERGNRMKSVSPEVKNTNGFRIYPKQDKGLNEPGTNVPIWWNDTFDIKIPEVDSYIVYNIHTRHNDEPGGNTRGHHSFLVIFQYTTGLEEPVEPPTPQLPPLKQLFTIDELKAIESFPLQKLRELVK